MLTERLPAYGAPANKIARMVEAGELVPIKKGFYETDPATPAEWLAGVLCAPSYISFEYALSRHGLIPERVHTVTCASFGKRKKKRYENAFGAYTFRDVPRAAFPWGVEYVRGDGFSYRIASPEKALCDQVYQVSARRSLREMRALLFEDLRIDEDLFAGLDRDDVAFLADLYKSTNVRLLSRVLDKM
jgi:predicted transcriptional regulator of viral defense system